MKKKILNAVELLFLLATFVILNLKTIEVVSSAVPTEATQFVSTISLWKNYILSYPIYFFYIVIAVMCVVSIVTKSEYREGRIHSILPIIWFALVIMKLITTQGENGAWLIVSSENFPQEVFMFLALGVVIFGFVKRASFVVENTNKQSNDKEILDTDVITQKENNKISSDITLKTDECKKVKQKSTKNKKIIMAVFVVLIVIAFTILYKPKFERVKDECVHIAGMVSGSGDYFTIDTYPDTYENMDETTKALLLADTQENALEAVKYANEELGFNGSVYSKMLETTALMGRQTEETDKYRVSWTYHPDDGLEVTYEKK